jgi:drug/metabolite transporter (DMT)-like permease
MWFSIIKCRRKRQLKVLDKIYWLRLVAGAAAGMLSTVYTYYAGEISSTNFTSSTFLNGLTIVLAIFLFTYYLFKFVFGRQVQKQQKLFTTGIGVYFIAWIAVWVLLYTLFAYNVI